MDINQHRDDGEAQDISADAAGAEWPSSPSDRPRGRLGAQVAAVSGASGQEDWAPNDIAVRGGPPAPPRQGPSPQAEATAPAPPRRPRRRGAAFLATDPEAPPRPETPDSARRISGVDFSAGSRCPSTNGHPPALEPAIPTNHETRSRNRHRAPAPRPGSDETDRLLITKEVVARQLSISVRQGSRFVADGSLVPVRLGSRLVRFTPDAIADFLVRMTEADQQSSVWPGVARERRRCGDAGR